MKRFRIYIEFSDDNECRDILRLIALKEYEHIEIHYLPQTRVKKKTLLSICNIEKECFAKSKTIIKHFIRLNEANYKMSNSSYLTLNKSNFVIDLLVDGYKSMSEIQKSYQRIKKYTNDVELITRRETSCAYDVYCRFNSIGLPISFSELVYYDGMVSWFDEWLYDPKATAVNLFTNVLSVVLMQYGFMDCKHSSCLGRTLYFQINKKVSICPLHIKETDIGGFDKISDVDELFNDDAFLKYLVSSVESRKECSSKCEMYNICQGGCVFDKDTLYNKYYVDFVKHAKDRISSFCIATESLLKKEIASFAEYNYDNPNAKKEWEKIIKKHEIEAKANSLLTQLSDECQIQVAEISREIQTELKLKNAFKVDSCINMRKVVDGKKICNWSTTVISGVLGTGGMFFPPLLWATAVVGVIGTIGSFLFTDKNKKVSEARTDLEHKLCTQVEHMIGELKSNIETILESELIGSYLSKVNRVLNETISAIFALSETQRSMAISLNAKLQEINKDIVKQALKYTDFEGLEWHIRGTARIPGFATILVIEYGTVFPNDAAKAISRLLKEEVWYLIRNNNIKSMLVQAIWKKSDRAEIELDKIRIQSIHNVPLIAHIPFLGECDEFTVNRIRMAQQITELLIMK